MNNKYIYLLVTVLVILFSVVLVLSIKNDSIKYPIVYRDEAIVDDYHGVKIPDPYRWLEDPYSEDTEDFIEAENNLTNSYLNSEEVSTYRNKIGKVLSKLRNYSRRGIPSRHGDKYYFDDYTGLDDYSTLKVMDGLEGEPRVFVDFDDEFFSNFTEEFGMEKYSFSEDGSLFAFSISDSGSDWVSVYVKNATSGEYLDDEVGPTKFPLVAWTHDNLGFFYTKYRDDTGNASGTETSASGQRRIFYHRLGTDQEEDKLVKEFNDRPKNFFAFHVSDDGKYLVVYLNEGGGNSFVYIGDLKPFLELNKEIKLVEVTNGKAGLFSYVTNDDSVFYFKSNSDAPKYKLLRLDLNKHEKKYWEDVIPEREDVLNKAIAINKNFLIVSYTKDVKSTLELRHLHNGSLITEYPLQIGSISSTSGRRKDSLFFFDLATFTNPQMTYKIDFNKDYTKAEVFQRPVSNINQSDFKVEQVFYKSKDGTKIPMFIIQSSDFKKDGSAPAYLYSYGGFNKGQSPGFSTSRILFVKHFKGVWAIPSIRGGGEYGKEWWDGGRHLKKQNSFDDFAAAAEYVINNNYTSAAKLTAHGTSAGGLLVAATVNQRPELFGAALPQVGVMDMLRFQKFTVGHFWCGEFGCSENKTHFDNLLKYSPLHNIRVPGNNSVQYPAILVKAGDHDDRVPPLHSYKYIAELQYTIGQSKQQTNPLLLWVKENTGHGGDKSTSGYLSDASNTFAFLAKVLNLTFYD